MAASPRLRRSVFTLIYWLLFIISTLTYPWAPIAAQKKQLLRVEASKIQPIKQKILVMIYICLKVQYRGEVSVVPSVPFYIIVSAKAACRNCI